MSTVQIVSSDEEPLSSKKRPPVFDKATGREVVHSMTIYLPREHNNFFFDSVKHEAMAMFGKEGSKTSKFVMDLIKKHLTKRGYFDAEGNPDIKFLERIKKNNLKD